MWIVDRRTSQRDQVSRTSSIEAVSVGQAVWIGFCQLLSAVFPGTSRSMSTITGGQAAGLTRSAALEFSFFLAIPTMLAATLYDLAKAIHASGSGTSLGSLPPGSQAWGVLIIGLVTAFISAWLSVHMLVTWVKNKSFAPFAIYRIVVGIAVLWWLA